MTQEIIQMARDSGMELYGLGKDRARFVFHLEAFAKLVAEAERERIKQANAPEIEKINAHIQKAMTDLEEVLAEHAMCKVQRLGQEIEQEPVAWMDADGNVSDNNDHKCFPIPLYTTPLQRTEPPQKKVWTFWNLSGGDITDAIKAKLKEKNT